MSDVQQNDWDVVEQTLHEAGKEEALATLERLREMTSLTIESLNARITELEWELEVLKKNKPWPGQSPSGEWQGRA